MSKNDDTGLLIFSIILIGFGTFLIGEAVGIRLMKDETVEKNHAEYVADKKGNVKFVWKETNE